MNALEIGVFVDAHHLLSVRRQDRLSAAILHRVTNAAMQLALTSGFAQRVIIADCGDSAARQIAEDFGINSGFRMRHVPEAHKISRPAVIVAEITEALSIPTLRTIVAIAPVLDIAPAIDTAHRAGKAVIMLTSDVKTPGAMEAVIQLPLDTSVLHSLVNKAATQLKTEGSPLSDQVLHQRLRQLQPGFSPLHYGYRDAAHMMRMLREGKLLGDAPSAAVASSRRPPANGRLTDANGGPESRQASTYVRPESRTRPDSRQAATHVRQPSTQVRPNYSSSRQDNRQASEPAMTDSGLSGAPELRSLCRPLARTRESASELIAALRQVLTVIEETPDFLKQAETGSLQTGVVSAGFRVAAPNYSSGLFDMKFSPIALAAIAGSNWRLMRNEQNPADIRLVYGRIDIPGFARIPRSR